jgi:tetratricopeptide (TPR) repeat protein
VTAQPDAASTPYATDFFVSHADADVEWGAWIASELELAGYGVVVRAWDFRPGENLLTRIDEALTTCRHTIAVLSDDAESAEVAARSAAHYQGLEGKERALIPVRVSDCKIPPLLGPIMTIDLREVEEGEARTRLRTGLEGRGASARRGKYPGKQQNKVRFPGAETTVWELRGHRPDPNFTGRDDTLAGVHRAFRAGRPTSAIQALTGLFGLGKTRLAIEYAHRHAAAYDAVWWVRAENEATLQGDYAELARELGLPFDKDSQAIAALRRKLRQEKNWLIIFDNAEKPDDVFPLLPDRHSGHVLITSQRHDWPHAETWPLAVLPPDTAAAYLVARGKVADGAVAREVAEALGGLPLALAQAASVIADGVGAGEYLDELRKDSPELFDQGDAVDYHQTVVSTWRASFTRLAAASSTAADLFRLGAFLAAEAIPLAGLQPVDGMSPELVKVLTDPFRRRGATHALAEYSLAETGDGLVSVHRLVQAVTRAELGEDQPRWAELALRVVAASFPDDVGNPATWQDCEALLGHAITCADHASRLQVDVATACRLRNRVARYLLERGRHDRADVILDQALAAAEQFLPDDPILYDLRNAQGLLRLAQGDYAAALALQEDVYAFRGRVLGPDHLETLRAGGDLARMLFVQGHWSRVRALQDQLVERFSAVAGTEHLETIKAIAYQATLFTSAGEYGRAQELQERVLDARQRMLGDDHPSTVDAIAELSKTFLRKGDLKKARELQSQVVEFKRRLLGEEHPGTLSAVNNLAVVLWEQGAVARTQRLQQQVLEDNRRLLGEEHPATLILMANVASTHERMGELHAARKLYERALDFSTRVLGDEHPNTITALSGLASTLSAQGELDDALSIRQQVLEARRSLFGEEHPDTLEAMTALAGALRNHDAFDEELALVQQALEIYRRVFGDEHPHTFDAVATLSETLHARGDLVAARIVGEQLLQTYRRLLGDEHLKTLAASFSLSTILAEEGALEAADSLLSETLETCLRAFGRKNSMTTQITWQLITMHTGPHEAAKRRMLEMNLAWLSKAEAIHLTAEQRQVLDALRKSRFGSGGSTKKRPKRRR